MTDPASAITLSGLMTVGSAAKILHNSVTHASQNLSLAHSMVKRIYELSDGTGITPQQLNNIEEFLSSDLAWPALRSLMLIELIKLDPGTANSHDESENSPFDNLFDKLILEWNATRKSNQKISKKLRKSILVGTKILFRESVQNLTPSAMHDGNLYDYSLFLNRGLADRNSLTSNYSTFVESILDLTSDINLLSRIPKIQLLISSQIKSAGARPITEHLTNAPRIDREKLYVDREFRNKTQVVSSTQFLNPSSKYRVVLCGNPGAGKTTFVRHLQTKLSTKNDTSSVVISCHAYMSEFNTIGLDEYIRTSLNLELSLKIELSEIRALLSLGEMVVIFDGLDEVTEVEKRATLSQRINAFASYYPAIPILVTSRIVGYESAPLSSQIFDQLTIDEFNQIQIKKYALKWFSNTQSRNLADSFLRESKEIDDIRRNPLLLSLLCNLYKQTGSVPTNRLDIYAECARLLFKDWDGRRKISAVGASPHYQDKLFGEIAYWFHSSPEREQGCLDTQLRIIVKRYLYDAQSFSENDAEIMSQDFIEYCAGRAWLLSKVGNQNNSQIIGFTHRTFFEYYTAKAIVSKSEGTREIAAAILKEPSGTVIPELIIRHYDSLNDNGATRLINELCKPRPDGFTDPALILRLLEGVTLSRGGYAAAFDYVASKWQRTIDPSRFVDLKILLRINQQGQTAFNSYLNGQASPAFRANFLSIFSYAYFSSGTFEYMDSWTKVVDATLQSSISEEESADPAIQQYCLSRNLNVISSREDLAFFESALAIRTVGLRPVAGAVSRYLEYIEMSEPKPEEFDKIINYLHDEFIENGKQVAYNFLESVSLVLDYQYAFEKAQLHSSKLNELLVYLLLATYDAQLNSQSLIEACDVRCGFGLTDLIISRMDADSSITNIDDDGYQSRTPEKVLAQMTERFRVNHGVSSLSESFCSLIIRWGSNEIYFSADRITRNTSTSDDEPYEPNSTDPENYDDQW